MQKKSEDFSIKDAQRLMDNPAVPQLIKTLKQSDPDALAKAKSLAAAGDYEKAAQILQSLLTNGDAAKLFARLGGGRDG